MEDLRAIESATEKLRMDCLLGDGENDPLVGLDPFAEQFALQGLALLEQAQRAFALARLHQTRALRKEQR